MFNGIKDAVLGLPTLILDGIKEIFIPDTDAISADFNNMIESIENRLGLTTDSLEALKDGITEVPLSDINAEYSLPGVKTFTLPFMETSFVRDAIAFFRPLIRGFIILLLIFFNYKQLLSFIGQDPNIANNAHEGYESWKGAEK